MSPKHVFSNRTKWSTDVEQVFGHDSLIKRLHLYMFTSSLMSLKASFYACSLTYEKYFSRLTSKLFASSNFYLFFSMVSYQDRTYLAYYFLPLRSALVHYPRSILLPMKYYDYLLPPSYSPGTFEPTSKRISNFIMGMTFFQFWTFFGRVIFSILDLLHGKWWIIVQELSELIDPLYYTCTAPVYSTFAYWLTLLG